MEHKLQVGKAMSVDREIYTESHSVVADIPGLVPGAHLNKGLGISFLRHVERCTSLMYILDATSSDPDLCTQLHTLHTELECYQRGMSDRVQFIVANKMDNLERAYDDKGLGELVKKTSLAVLPVSALYHWNIDVLLNTLTSGDLTLYQQHFCRQIMLM